jgi:light-regulated signal transduction histidine kinase (bacteriophytochrome)
MPSPRDAQHPLALRSSTSVPGGGSAGVASTVDDPSLAIRLGSAEQTLRDISHALAHDVRTSLRHVVSYAQLLGDPAHGGQPEHASRLALKVLDSSLRLQRLMESVSALARLQAVELQPESVDMAAMVRSVIRELDAQGGGVRVACRVANDLPPSWADAALMRRVLFELLHNAWRHALSHSAPCIDVHWEPVPGGGAYFVHDNGLGFDPEKAAELFGLFQRAHGTPAPGLGVGLAMVRRIVECHGGRVWATARPGQGASFGFSLPARGG